MREVFVVPEPDSLDFTSNWFVFDGFENFPEFLVQEFRLPKGHWKIKEIMGEGTGLEIQKEEVNLWGNKSVCYATILQLVTQWRGYLPELKITESLKFEFRGFHLDIARCRVPTIETFKKILRWLFLLKYTHFGIYFEDLFPWIKYPQIGKHRGRMNEEELKDIIGYGNRLGIEVFPSLELSGHMEHILSLPEFGKFSEWHRPKEGCLDLSNEDAREFAYDLLREVIDFFPSKYLHIGGDEAWATGRGKSLNKTWIFEGTNLYELHHKNMIEIAKKSGKKPIIWGDMISGSHMMGDVESSAKWIELAESKIWKEAIAANWIYYDAPEKHFKEKIAAFKEKGIQQLACPGLNSEDTYYPFFDRALGNLESFLAAAREEDLPGFLVTAWGDMGGECLLSFLDPLILAAMEFGEGNGKWQEKWVALTGETKDVLQARILFGKSDISNVLKRAVFRDFFYHRLDQNRKEELENLWKDALKKIECTVLPEDLDFVRRLLGIGIKVLDDDIQPSDYLAAATIYAKLWLKERKREGLDRIIERFWGAAGKQDLKLWTPRFQDWFLDL